MNNAEKCSFVVKEVSEKAGKKGAYWSITDLMGLKYNASKDNYPEIHPNDTIEGAFTTAEYEVGGKKIHSRWLCKPGVEGKDPIDMAKSIMGVKESAKVSTLHSNKDVDRIVAAILAICANSDEALKKYQELLGKM